MKQKNNTPPIENIIFFDTCSIIDALYSKGKKASSCDVRNRQVQVIKFYQDLSRQGVTCGISVISIAEALVDIDPKQRFHAFDELKRGFIFLGFTDGVAEKTAELYDQLGLKNIKGQKKDRSTIKDDLKILASILYFGAKKLYTVDNQLRKYAEKFEIELFPKNI